MDIEMSSTDSTAALAMEKIFEGGPACPLPSSKVIILNQLQLDPSLQDHDTAVTVPHFLSSMLRHNALPATQGTYGLIDEFRAQIDAALLKTRDQMFDIDRQIDSLLQQRREFEFLEKESLKKLFICKVASSPFRRIPLNILREISFFVLQSEDGGSNPCITLSHVSSAWRKAVLGSPRLWTSLSICLRDKERSKGHLLEYFGRAGLLPLKLKIQRAVKGSWFPGRSMWIDFFQWLLYIWPKIQQVVSLDIAFSAAGWPETNGAVDFRSLKRLVFQDGLFEGGDHGAHFPHIFSLAPHLVTLRVGDNYPQRKFSFPWSQLIRLSLFQAISPQNWLDILDECINLHFGSFSLCAPEHGNIIGTEHVSRAQTSLQNLRLSIDRDIPNAFQVIRSRIFLNVAVLTIDSTTEGGEYCLKSHFPSLEHLVLMDYGLRSERIFQILLSNQSLNEVSLDLDGCPKLQIPFFRNFLSRITGDTMPNLSGINIIVRRNEQAIDMKYVKAFSCMVRAWYKSVTSSCNTQALDSYSVQLQILPTDELSVPNFYEELGDCMDQGLELVVKAD